MLTDSADQSSAQSGAVGAVLADETTAARNSPATADHCEDMTGKALGGGGAYSYGYDSAGNPTLAVAGYYRPSDRNLPH
ncbi:MAG: hypothetical protein WBH47_21910 [Streptosporangiaceae bacterium]